MRLALLALVGLVALGSAARADELKPFVGKLVISPDAPPTAASELPAYLKANLTKDNAYDLIKGPPWSVHLVGVLAKDAKVVRLELADKTEPKLAPLVSIELTPKRRVVIAHLDATVAAGFATGKTYAVRLVAGKKLLARCELTLRD